MNFDKLAGYRRPPPHQHGTDADARRPAEAGVSLPPGPAFIQRIRKLPWPYERLDEWGAENIPEGYTFQPATDDTAGGWVRPHGSN